MKIKIVYFINYNIHIHLRFHSATELRDLLNIIYKIAAKKLTSLSCILI